MATTADSKSLSPDLTINGGELKIEPDNIDPIEFTFFDCWGSENKDGNIETFYEWDSKESIEICLELIRSFEEILNKSLALVREAVELGMYRTREAFFDNIKKIFLKAGYFVYSSDTRFEIYDGNEMRASFTRDEILKMLNLTTRVAMFVKAQAPQNNTVTQASA